MGNKKNVPTIRFKGFAEEWKMCELKDICAIKTGYPFNSIDFSEDGTFRVITNGNIQDDSAIVNSSLGNKVNIDDKQIIEEYSLNIGDILVTMDGTVGRSAKVTDSYMILAQRVGRLVTSNNAEFLYQLLNVGVFYKTMTAMSVGGTIKHISLSGIAGFSTLIPIDVAEQNKLGIFLKNIDDLIAKTEQQIDKLKNIKKACLEKMFPRNGSNTPEIRFKGFSEIWNTKYLSNDEFDVVAGGDVDREKLTLTGRYPVFANALVNDGIVGYYDQDYRIAAPAVTVTGRGDVGYAKARKINFTPVVRLLVVKSKHDVDYLENAINKHKILVESTGVPQLTVPQIKKYKIWFPHNRSEEEKIGLFLLRLDSLMNLHNQKINKLKNIKKACLDKMFVN